VKLIVPRCVRPFIKRQKNDAAEAEAIVEAALRPTMHYVEPKTGDQHAWSILFSTREQFVMQRTEAVDALRSHLYELRFIAPEGSAIFHASVPSSKRRTRICHSSAGKGAATSRLGLVWSRDKPRPAASRSSGKPRRWANATFAAC
jgi:hypothetical protein